MPKKLKTERHIFTPLTLQGVDDWLQVGARISAGSSVKDLPRSNHSVDDHGEKEGGAATFTLTLHDLKPIGWHRHAAALNQPLVAIRHAVRSFQNFLP